MENSKRSRSTPIDPQLGTRAIQYLESLHGFKLSTAEAEAQWNKLNDLDKHFNVNLYKQFVMED